MIKFVLVILFKGGIIIGYLTALLPILGWGIMPILANLKKVSVYVQLFGVSISALIFSVILIFVSPPHFTIFSFLISFLSGAFWSLGQLYQFKAIKNSSVSKAMPVSNGTQLIFTTLIGAFLFGEWDDSFTIFTGLLILFLLTLGIIMISYSEKQSQKLPAKVFIEIVLSSIYLACYVSLNKFFKIETNAVLLPQSIAMFMLSGFLVKKNNKVSLNLSVLSFPIYSGIAWSIANFGMNLTNQILGVSLGYALSQCCVIVSTVGGIFIFRERKKLKEWIFISLGFIFMLIGIFGLSLL